MPDGDTGKLDKASTAWNQLATGPGTTAVVQALSGNAAKFRDTKSPEVEYIVKDLDELHQAADAILGSCAELAQSCSEYKTSLDDLRTKMKADPRYPNGYVMFTNEHNQPITLDGKPGSRAETHIPRNPDGSYPIPKGW